ncbi:MAG: serine--tRNA ligase, partial [Planctomycetota bacterium]|nr:serine--tRNA ligase [Planctomycetota bacterium]
MLDRKFVVENAELVAENCRRRNSPADIERLLGLEQARKANQAMVDDLNRRANEVSKSIGKATDAADREARKEEGRRLRDECTRAQAELETITAESDAILRTIPNMSHPDAPIGSDDQANLE